MNTAARPRDAYPGMTPARRLSLYEIARLSTPADDAALIAFARKIGRPESAEARTARVTRLLYADGTMRPAADRVPSVLDREQREHQADYDDTVLAGHAGFAGVGA